MPILSVSPTLLSAMFLAMWCSANPAVAKTSDVWNPIWVTKCAVTVMYPSVARLVHMSVVSDTPVADARIAFEIQVH